MQLAMNKKVPCASLRSMVEATAAVVEDNGDGGPHDWAK
jgi:hypothetical protein